MATRRGGRKPSRSHGGRFSAIHRHRRCTLAFVAAATITIMIFDNTLPFDASNQSQEDRGQKRRLKSSKLANSKTQESQQTYPPDFRADLGANLEPVHSGPTSSEGTTSSSTPLFWHVPKAGGTSVKSYYVNCRGVKLAHYDDTVDIVSRPGVIKAKETNLVSSHSHDMLMSALFHPAIDLFDESNRGRLFAMFRHPVEIIVSQYYYLQHADWEPSYDPKLGDTPIEDFAAVGFRRDWITRNLAAVPWKDELTQEDFDYAKKVLGDYFLIGLTSKADESTERFDTFFGIEYPTDPQLIANCGGKKTGGVPKENEYPHPKVQKGGKTWNKIAALNEWDSKLYAFVEALYEDQTEKFFSSKKTSKKDEEQEKGKKKVALKTS